jgi:hypothetical protein
LDIAHVCRMGAKSSTDRHFCGTHTHDGPADVVLSPI